MERPDETRLLAVLEATWPSASVDETAVPGWRLRDGAGGGKRVSSAVSLGGRNFEAVAEAMRARGERPLIQVPGSDEALDRALEEAGWEIVDPTVLMVGRSDALAALPLPKQAKNVHVRARLVLLDEIWEAGGVDAARRAVMARCPLPHVTVLSRTDEAVAGVAWVAVDGDVGMVHAIEVRAEHRRQGSGRSALAGAARFAAEQGAPWLALAVTEANAPARAMYEAAGMETVARYRYRRAP